MSIGLTPPGRNNAVDELIEQQPCPSTTLIDQHVKPIQGISNADLRRRGF